MTKTINPSGLLDRLKHLRRTTYPNVPPNTMLLLYAQQGLLARLDASTYAGHFDLKGALSLFTRYGDAARPTQDLDLATQGLPNTPEEIRRVPSHYQSGLKAKGIVPLRQKGRAATFTWGCYPGSATIHENRPQHPHKRSQGIYLVRMTEPRWTPTEHAYHLDEAYAEQQGEEDCDTDLVTLKLVAYELDSDPELLEAAWEVWSEELTVKGYTEKQIDEAWYWLEAVVIDELAKD